jgi:hypothetical protein
MHLTWVIFLLGAGATRGLAREALRRTIPECFRLGAAGSLQSDSAPSLSKRSPGGRQPLTVWLRLPTARSLGLL